MPLIKYLCTNDLCGSPNAKLYGFKSTIDIETECKKCGSKARRVLSSPASSSKIVIDNGLQARSVEVSPNIIEINSERARKPVDRGD